LRNAKKDTTEAKKTREVARLEKRRRRKSAAEKTSKKPNPIRSQREKGSPGIPIAEPFRNWWKNCFNGGGGSHVNATAGKID
jgi:hypothetical protein